nr:methyltransferase domain-containing protein [uncultured Anaerostipes sp.]
MTVFEFDGEKYKKVSGHQKKWGNHLIEELNLKGGETILDLGCGDGVLTARLAGMVPEGRVTGIDASQGMIRTARQNEKENLEFLCMDISQMEFHESYDIIFSNAALHWIPDHKNLLKRSWKALKPGGMLLWNFAGEGNCKNFFEEVRAKIKEEKYKKYFQDFQWPWYMPAVSEYRKLTESCDFTEIEVSEENRDTYFENAEALIGWMDQPSLVPFMKRLPDREGKEFRQEMIEKMLRETVQPDGRYLEAFRRIHLRARKKRTDEPAIKK